MSNGAREGDFDLSGPETLDKSSADFDQALREIDRRSPLPLLDGVKDFDEEGEVGRDGTGSNEPGLDSERSKTDLRSSVNAGSRHPGENSGWKRGNAKQTFTTMRRRGPTRKKRRGV